jgi:hypothetical protein
MQPLIRLIDNRQSESISAASVNKVTYEAMPHRIISTTMK